MYQIKYVYHIAWVIVNANFVCQSVFMIKTGWLTKFSFSWCAQLLLWSKILYCLLMFYLKVLKMKVIKITGADLMFVVGMNVRRKKWHHAWDLVSNIIQIVDGEESNTENIGRRNSCIGRGVAFLSPIFSVLDDSTSTNCYILIPLHTRRS